MRTRYLLGILAVLLLVLAVWVVPLALAATGGSPAADASAAAGPDAAEGSASQCPFLQAHPWMDPHGSNGGTDGASYQTLYY